jgi:uncharacterized protein (DUF1684 family)
VSELQDLLDLLDWKRRVFELYAAVRADSEPERAWGQWRATRDALIATHPQSPRLGARPDYFPYDPELRFVAEPEPLEPESLEIAGSAESLVRFTRVARVRVPVGELDLYWLDAYGGGLFLPFRDATAGTETYGAGRYLLDTVKGADLGADGDGRLVLDFNFAYNPSCSYDDRWACPLAPPANRLEVGIRAGERDTRIPA